MYARQWRSDVARVYVYRNTLQHSATPTATCMCMCNMSIIHKIESRHFDANVTYVLHIQLLHIYCTNIDIVQTKLHVYRACKLTYNSYQKLIYVVHIITYILHMHMRRADMQIRHRIESRSCDSISTYILYVHLFHIYSTYNYIVHTTLHTYRRYG